MTSLSRRQWKAMRKIWTKSKLYHGMLESRLDKCHFFRRRVNYLGHVIEPGKLSVQATKVDTILKAKLARTRTELGAYLGICNVYRRFVPKLATIAAPLTRHLLKDSPDSFDLEESPDAVAAFEQLRPMLTFPPTLALPNVLPPGPVQSYE
jgi:hypothetical protein